MSMSTYRVVWMMLMIFVVVPAFVMASGMEGLDFHGAAVYTLITLQDYGLPNFVASLLAYPVTIVATMIPGTSSLAALLGDFLWQGLGIVFLVVFFIHFEPPFYRPAESVSDAE